MLKRSHQKAVERSRSRRRWAYVACATGAAVTLLAVFSRQTDDLEDDTPRTEDLTVGTVDWFESTMQPFSFENVTVAELCRNLRELGLYPLKDESHSGAKRVSLVTRRPLTRDEVLVRLDPKQAKRKSDAPTLSGGHGGTCFGDP